MQEELLALKNSSESLGAIFIQSQLTPIGKQFNKLSLEVANWIDQVETNQVDATSALRAIINAQAATYMKISSMLATSINKLPANKEFETKPTVQPNVEQEKTNQKPAMTVAKKEIVKNKPQQPRKARFTSNDPMVNLSPENKQVQETPVIEGYLGSMYHDILATSQSPVKQVAIKSVPLALSNARTPQVYFPPEADSESHAASVVDSEASSVMETEEERVIALHDFDARSDIELSIRKGDIIMVRKRQGTWIFGRILKSHAVISGSQEQNPLRFRRGPPQPQHKKETNYGWIPAAFVTKYRHH
ncbi:hypothetical protein HK103_003646 [Boothiomyces macroporosus]|uniref:SH3 domain-containing protein n=1 Tax=Boothiomyces macroporosus TaxID=261099 RepID=A0AAD5Y4H2_9FUNG|nr:hypothetical protein HK103_003646 [Boothiomyces macroporosus]